jgi:hypothetical protein
LIEDHAIKVRILASQPSLPYPDSLIFQLFMTIPDPSSSFSPKP